MFLNLKKLVFLDVYYINKGMGDTIFMVFWDGTTLLDDTSEEHKIQAKYGPYKSR